MLIWNSGFMFPSRMKLTFLIGKVLCNQRNKIEIRRLNTNCWSLHAPGFFCRQCISGTMICSLVSLRSLRSNLSPCLQVLPLLQASLKLLLLKLHGDFTGVGLQPAVSLAILRQAIFSGKLGTDCLVPAWVQDGGRLTSAASTVLTV